MAACKFSAVIESDVYQVKDTVGKALEFLKGIFPELSESAFFDLRLIMSEALINAVTHGNECNKSKKVTFTLNVRGSSLITVQISDEGEGFDYETVMNDKGEKDIMQESGRGVKLVCLLSDKVVFNKKGNGLKIYKKVVPYE